MNDSDPIDDAGAPAAALPDDAAAPAVADLPGDVAAPAAVDPRGDVTVAAAAPVDPVVVATRPAFDARLSAGLAAAGAVLLIGAAVFLAVRPDPPARRAVMAAAAAAGPDDVVVVDDVAIEYVADAVTQTGAPVFATGHDVDALGVPCDGDVYVLAPDTKWAPRAVKPFKVVEKPKKIGDTGWFLSKRARGSP